MRLSEKLQLPAQSSNGQARAQGDNTVSTPVTYATKAQPARIRLSDPRVAEQSPPSTLRQHQLAIPTKIRFNAKGHRIDEKVGSDASQLPILKNLKLCNRYFLTRCHFTDCKHRHEYPHKLDKQAVDTLRFIARLSQCRDKYYEDRLCVGGHQCPYDRECQYRSK